MVTAAVAQKRRTTSDKKVASHVTRRGMVPDNFVERRKGKTSLGPLLLGFFMVVIVGSSLLQIINSASRKS
eukprot:CAMPEP_0183350814 /NCGR_PEP_ID=MMETSP0164_2-20130417/21055_1 /TAXON_ID=221442 /ORGANISM="Coccolithus pelagicus ssp braarudi, Strain PLY182g" /LENGTH=70 /DNA_ID=CAMNT_0025522813 /DNA_START=21 /DNA_END=233 /DNA_ORIENTATION=+